MSIDYEQVRRAFRKTILEAELENFPAEEFCCWENRLFTPPDKELWVRETLLRSDEQLVATNQLCGSGIYQLDVFVPKGSGTELIGNLTKAIADLFKPASAIQDDNGLNVAIDRATPLVGQLEPSWYSVPVQVTWRTYASNNE